MFLRLAGRDVRLVVHHADATDADLARMAGLPRPSSPRPLADLGLRRGHRLDGPTDGDVVGRPGAITVAVVGGLDSGRSVGVGDGGVVEVGRDRGCTLVIDDPSVSRRHARLTVDDAGAARLHDVASRNGTWLVDEDGERLVDGVVAVPATGALLRLGASTVAVTTPCADDLPVGGIRRPTGLTGTAPHNRPPRPALPPAPEPVLVPSPPEPSGSRLPLGIAAIVGPVAMAGAMVWLLGNPAFALFALLSPVLAIGNHVEGRRREKKGSRRQAARWAEELATFCAALAETARVERARRLASAPDCSEVLRRALQPSMWLWERRTHHDDWLRLRVGTGDVRCDPPLAGERHGPRPADIVDAVEAAGVLRRAPVTVDLAGGGVVGLVGDRAAALAVARSLLVQAAVHHGPSDLAVLLACEPTAVDDVWDWVKWLPHVEDPTGGPRRVATDRATADSLAASWRPGAGPTLLAVVDGDELLAGRRAPLRALLDGRSGPVAGIVVAATGDRLPAACSAVLVLDPDGRGELSLPARGSRVADVAAMGVGADTAACCARALARFDDPELDGTGAALPPVVALADLLELPVPSAAAVAARWAAAGPDPAPVTPLGVDADGRVDVDLADDGPHALVAGTTGAGKSELLRSLVAGLAVGSSPDHLTFVLVDFKGGSAFDACARLPHTVGLVTDLDAALAERALRCLEAELRHRERVLRSAGAADLAAYRAGGAADPLPRLVVVVDEFATLKAELPDFVDALVGIAQRGRSLGVHLVLATQRPAGSVSDHVKANANLRIALRVQDVADSTDVIDGPAAAALPRSRPGRACVRLGPGELLTIQTALATARSAAARPPVELVPFTLGPEPVPAPRSVGGAGPTDLERLVDACADAFAAGGWTAPRRPWPEPLPDRLGLDDPRLAAAPPGLAVVGLADDPDRQRQEPAGWRPADGNLAVYGLAGSGTTTTLLAVAHARARSLAPGQLQIFGLDGGAGELAALSGLPHVAAVIGATERERQQRLVRHLRTELDRRKAAAPEARRGLPEIDVLVDGVGSFLADFDDIAGMEVLDAFARVFAGGPEVGIRVIVSAERAGALPAALAATVRQRWIHRLADAMDAATVGVGRGPGAGDRCAALPTGRYLDASTGSEVQVAVPRAGWPETFAAVAAGASARPAAAPAIGTLPVDVDLAALRPRALGPRPWTVVLGVADHDLEPAHLTLHEGDHVLVAGPARSGRTTTLATLATAVLGATPEARVVALAGRRSWLRDVPGIDVADGVVPAVAAVSGAPAGTPAFLLVDDADAVDDVDGALEALVAAGSGPHVVAAGRADVLRGLYHHWTRAVRRSHLGVLLRPHVDLDGELLGAALPRRSTAPWVDGRGYLVADGAASLVQVARLPGWRAG